MKRVIEPGRGKWALAAWILWICGIIGLGLALIHRASTVMPTPSGLEFDEIMLNAIALAPWVILSSVLSAILFPKRPVHGWVLSLVICGGMWAFVYLKLTDIQFVRTPPCWGMHSIDPGSGEGCPRGMRADFTVAQLRDYYRKVR